MYLQMMIMPHIQDSLLTLSFGEAGKGNQGHDCDGGELHLVDEAFS